MFTASAIGSLSIPLYDGGVTYAHVRQAQEQLGQARLQADLARGFLHALGQCRRIARQQQLRQRLAAAALAAARPAGMEARPTQMRPLPNVPVVRTAARQVRRPPKKVVRAARRPSGPSSTPVTMASFMCRRPASPEAASKTARAAAE